jgi:hypothetical protein
VVKGLAYILDYWYGLIFFKSLFSFQQCIQLPIDTVFHQKVDVLTIVEKGVHFHVLAVVQVRLDLYFADQLLNAPLFVDHLFLDNLYCADKPCFPVRANIHPAEFSLANLVAQDKVFKN